MRGAGTTEPDDTLCPISRSSSLIGDKWSLVIVRELFFGVARFQGLLAQTGATGQMLAARLKRLEVDGLIERRVYSRRPLRHDYLLTPKGRDLMPVILALRAFGEAWCKSPDDGFALQVFHRACGTELPLDGVCPACRRLVAWPEMQGRPTPAYAAERARRAEEFAGRAAETTTPLQDRSHA
jgi:DNA-binding HxlR family transcriptional regulator